MILKILTILGIIVFSPLIVLLIFYLVWKYDE